MPCIEIGHIPIPHGGYRSTVIKTNNNGIRTYDPYADKQFRTHLISHNDSKGTVTHRSHIFIDNYVLPPAAMLCPDAKESITIDNAGGKSNISEMYSIDYFTQVYGATNTIFEEDVNYWIDYKMVDFICTLNINEVDIHLTFEKLKFPECTLKCDDKLSKNRVGVSVARAMGYPTSDRFTSGMASRLLYKKLYGLIVARNAVVKEQSFFKSILHIWCQDLNIAQLLREAFANLDDNDYGLDVKGVLLLQLTICDDPQIYRNYLRK